MKKKFGKLFIIFGVLLCIFAFYGCGEEAESTDQSSETTESEVKETTSAEITFSEITSEETTAAEKETSIETTEPGIETTETEVKTVETSETEETSDQTEEASSETESFTESVETTESTSEESSETEEESTEETWISGTVVPEGSDLIAELIDYLYYLHIGHEMIPPDTYEDSINKIKNGTQPLLVTFDSNISNYFVCGYFEREDTYHSGAEKYTWVRYRNQNEIREYYNGKKIAVAFQINKAVYLKDVFPRDKATPKMEHFKLFEPEFVDGLNINDPIDFYDTFIYLNSTYKDTIYYSTDKYNYYNYYIPCVFYKNQYFLKIYIVTKYYDGRPDTKTDPKSMYGNYCDAMMEILLPQEGVAYMGNDLVHIYGLIPIDDFVNKVLK